jgi:two-component system OmpR family sensor kinase
LARVSGSGFGLGLSIAQAIAQAHGSEITVESAPGVGARFSLTLKA